MVALLIPPISLLISSLLLLLLSPRITSALSLLPKLPSPTLRLLLKNVRFTTILLPYNPLTYSPAPRKSVWLLRKSQLSLLASRAKRLLISLLVLTPLSKPYNLWLMLVSPRTSIYTFPRLISLTYTTVLLISNTPSPISLPSRAISPAETGLNSSLMSRPPLLISNLLRLNALSPRKPP